MDYTEQQPANDYVPSTDGPHDRPKTLSRLELTNKTEKPRISSFKNSAIKGEFPNGAHILQRGSTEGDLHII